MHLPLGNYGRYELWRIPKGCAAVAEAMPGALARNHSIRPGEMFVFSVCLVSPLFGYSMRTSDEH